VYHWARAALAPREITAPLGPSIVPLSNFSGKGPAPVASYGGMGPYGTFDIAGNVREWVWNLSTAGRRWILGGSWNDPDYMFSVPFSLPSEDRSPANGFRCISIEDEVGIPEALLSEVDVSAPDYRSARPVSDEAFDLFARQFAYIPSAAGAVVEARVDTPSGSVRERVTLDAGYGGERMSVYVFLPKDGRPPYQAVVYFPALNPFQSRMASRTFYPADYVVKSGRAVVLPVFKGSFERWDPALGLTGEEYFRAARQRLLQWRQDLGRTIDYLGTRNDIDMKHIGYYGRSFGASMPLPLLALEPRLKVAVLHSAGFTYRRLPAEMDAVNYVSRIRMPVLMMTGRHDYVFPYQTSQKPLFDLLGTPFRDKRHVIYDAGHDPLPRSQVVREILSWLDRYLGASGKTVE
jgi:dienelactone hydrolase